MIFEFRTQTCVDGSLAVCMKNPLDPSCFPIAFTWFLRFLLWISWFSSDFNGIHMASHECNGGYENLLSFPCHAPGSGLNGQKPLLKVSCQGSVAIALHGSDVIPWKNYWFCKQNLWYSLIPCFLHEKCCESTGIARFSLDFIENTMIQVLCPLSSLVWMHVLCKCCDIGMSWASKLRCPGVRKPGLSEGSGVSGHEWGLVSGEAKWVTTQAKV